MDKPVVAVKNLGRFYITSTGIINRKKQVIEALQDVSFDVFPKEIFGLVGPNGAGKTTLIKILSTLLLPTAGNAEILGLNVQNKEREIRQRINFIFGGERGLYWRLSGLDNLLFFADLYRIDRKVARERCKELLKTVDLWDRRDERVEGYSKGMKQRLHIAKALINEPEILFLDEPTIGLDPIAARMLRELISQIRWQGVTIFLTSHYMWEMEVLCDRIAVLKNGRILCIDTPKNLKQIASDLLVIELRVLGSANAIEKRLRNLPFITAVSVSAVGSVQTISIQSSNPDATITELKSAFSDNDLSNLVIRQPNLEDAYIQLIKGQE